MKKIISIMLAVALVLTTLALPMTAFAAVDPTDTLTLSYELAGSVENVKKGDTVTVNAVLKSSVNDITLEAWTVKLDNTEGFTYATPTGGENVTVESIDGGYYIHNINSETVTAAGVTLFSVVATVGAVTDGVSYELGTKSAQFIKDTSFAAGEAYGYYEWATWVNNLTITNLTLSGAKHSATIKVVDADSNEVAEGTTAYTSQVTVSVEDATSTYEAVIASEDAEGFTDITFTEGTQILTIKGTYTITVTLFDDTTVTRTVKLDPTEISAKIATAIQTPSDAGYKAGDTITIPLVLDLGEEVTAQAGMVTFTLEYDEAFLSLSATANPSYNDETGVYEFSYGDASGSQLYADGDTIDTLVFTVLDGVGATTINFENAQVAMDGNLTGDKLTAAMEDVTIVAVIEDFVTVSGINNELSNTGTITVAANDTAVEVKYYETTGEVTEPVTDPATYYNDSSAQAIPADGIDLDDDTKTYIIVSRIGTEGNYIYQAEVYDAADLKLDTTKPTVTGYTDMDAYLSTIDAAATVDLSSIVTADANGVKNGFKYAIADDTPTEASAYTEGTAVTIEAGTTVNSKLWLIYTDNAGNDSEPISFAIKYDGAAPAISGITVDEAADENGKKTLSFTVTDEGSGIKEVKVYKGAVADNVVVEGLTNEGSSYSIELSDAATYNIVAVDSTSDNTELHTTTAPQVVSFAEATAKDINVAVVKGAEVKTAGFFSVEDYAGIKLHDASNNLIDTNGTFTYVKVEIPAAATGFEDEVTITKDGAGELYEAGTTTYEFTEPGAYVITIKSKRTGSATTAEAVYKFSVVAADAMVTVNGDNRYNIIDFARMRAMLATDPKTPSDAYRFVGGYFSGDVTGNLENEVADYEAILTSLMAGKIPGSYDFAVLNPPASE